MNAERSPPPKLATPSSLFLLALSLLIVHLTVSAAVLQGSPNALERFPDDFYKVEGSPDIAAALERSRIYQGDETSLYLTLTNRGQVTSIEVNEEPARSAPEEVYAAKVELELENARTAAQDVSVSLLVPGSREDAPLEVKREVAYAGTLLEGQVSPRLEFPIEVYENAPPGNPRHILPLREREPDTSPDGPGGAGERRGVQSAGGRSGGSQSRIDG